MDYQGNISVTRSGKTCQRWDKQSPHRHDYAQFLFGGASVHENYCRNPKPNDEKTPWCYTTDPDVRFDLCDIPICGKQNQIFMHDDDDDDDDDDDEIST